MISHITHEVDLSRIERKENSTQSSDNEQHFSIFNSLHLTAKNFTHRQSCKIRK